MGAGGGPVRARRIEGWSGAPIATRVPALLLVAAVAFGDRSAALGTGLAAVLPAAAILVWRSLPQPIADPAGADCTSLLAPPAVWRFFEGAIGLVMVVGLVIDRRAALGELGLRRGSPGVRALALGSFLVIVPLAMSFASLVGGSTFGGMFFGSYSLDTSQPAALLPALVFAASNSVAEELAYRGAMRTWLAPGLGIIGANLAQAVVFGLSHTGDDFVGLEAVIPTMLAMILVGYVGGVVARRTRSLTLPLAIHAAADIPLYFYWACRLA